MEFLRFGSSIPGGYWGCCAMDIIQNLKQDPDEKASISCVDGDGGMPMKNGKGLMFLGPTWRDIFKQRLRINTFNSGDKPNHGFLAVLTDWQINSGHGKAWLKILKEEGFEFIRTVDNSVYSGSHVIKKATSEEASSNKNYLFGLFRNIGSGGHVGNPYEPPKGWTDLDQVVPEPWQFISEKDQKAMNEANQTHHLKRWEEIGPVKFLSEKELNEMNVPVTYAGVRSRYPEQSKAERERLQKEENEWKQAYKEKKGAALPAASSIFAPPNQTIADDLTVDPFDDAAITAFAVSDSIKL